VLDWTLPTTHRQKICKENVNFPKVVPQLIEQNEVRRVVEMDLA